MKETINVNVGSQAFTLDKDAYERLAEYLDDVQSRLAEDETGTMNDIEIRFAEIFNELRPSKMMVVSIDMVEMAIARMGQPDEFGPAKRVRKGTEEEPESKCTLRRSRTNRSIAGVCGGLAEHFGFDATALRLIMLFLILFGGLSIWVYIILWIIIPEEEVKKTNTKQRYERR